MFNKGQFLMLLLLLLMPLLLKIFVFFCSTAHISLYLALPYKIYYWIRKVTENKEEVAKNVTWKYLLFIGFNIIFFFSPPPHSRYTELLLLWIGNEKFVVRHSYDYFSFLFFSFLRSLLFRMCVCEYFLFSFLNTHSKYRFQKNNYSISYWACLVAVHSHLFQKVVSYCAFWSFVKGRNWMFLRIIIEVLRSESRTFFSFFFGKFKQHIHTHTVFSKSNSIIFIVCAMCVCWMYAS